MESAAGKPSRFCQALGPPTMEFMDLFARRVPDGYRCERIARCVDEPLQSCQRA
jgi:hypothetical protein